jgi:hypothetical protein
MNVEIHPPIWPYVKSRLWLFIYTTERFSYFWRAVNNKTTAFAPKAMTIPTMGNQKL